MNKSLKLDPKAVRIFAEKSNLKGAWILLFNWLLIAVSFALPIISTHPITIVISLIILANRQLGLAILMHECSHYSLFKTHGLNQMLGHAFCGAPVLADLNGYRTYHLKHHSEAGTTTDPDYPNYKGYPVTGKSWMRKILRDFTGVTGFKTLYAVLLMNAGILKYDMAFQSSHADKKLSAFQILGNLIKNLSLPLLVHLVMWSVLASLGHGWIYALWWVSYFSVYMFIIRVRNAAEHGNVPNLLDKNPLQHARTTYASWWERLTFAPNYVNYHLEHHLRPNIPCYNLRAFHQYLLNEGHLKDVRVATGYIDVLRQLSLKYTH